MKRIAVFFALLGAIVVMASVFLPWIHASDVGVIHSLSLSGWDVIHQSESIQILLAVGILRTDTHALMVFVAATVMLVCAFPAVFFSLRSKGDSVAIKPLSSIISFASVVVIAGLIWFVIEVSSSGIDIIKWSNFGGYGVYICGGGAISALISGMLLVVKKK